MVQITIRGCQHGRDVATFELSGCPPPTQQHVPKHAHSQIAQSALKNPPVQSHGFRKGAQNVMNVNSASYRVRGETSRAPQRSEVGESYQRACDEVRRSHARASPEYSSTIEE